jgi:hypothetical protein
MKKKLFIKDLPEYEKIAIFRLIALGSQAKDVAEWFNIRYGSIRHIVTAVWRGEYPEHYTKAESHSFFALRNNPPENL